MAKYKLPQEWTVREDYAEMFFNRRNGDRVRIIASPEDVCWLSLMRWCLDGKGRAFTYALTRKYCAMHRIVMSIQGSEEIDHINRDCLDNRRSNLRFCTHKQNLRNQGVQIGSKVPFKGVGFDRDGRKKPFRAKITEDGKLMNIGSYHTPEEAARAYDRKAVELHGDFALTNKELGLL